MKIVMNDVPVVYQCNYEDCDVLFFVAEYSKMCPACNTLSRVAVSDLQYTMTGTE